MGDKMADEKIKSTQTNIKVAVILHLLFTAVLMLLLAIEYSDEHENLIRLYTGSERRMVITVFGFLLDSLLTILWLYRPKLNTIHLVLYIIFGGILCSVYGIDLLNARGMGVALVVVFLAPFIWFNGLIPFLIYRFGIKKWMIVCYIILVVFTVDINS